MEDGLWENKENDNQEFESMNSRGEVTSELEITDSELNEVEAAIGFQVDNAFDEFRHKQFTSSDYETDAAANPEGNQMVLESVRDIPPEVLAHESIHGRMMQPEARNYLPGNNQFEQTIYDEFVARMAEDEIQPINVTDQAIEELRDAHNDYMDVREEHIDEVFTEQFNSLYQDILNLERTSDEEIHQEVDQRWRPYQMLREQVLASEAAKRYKEQNDELDINEFVNPDESLYHDTVGYIQQVEQDVLSG